jgi:hypothetical protein
LRLMAIARSGSAAVRASSQSQYEIPQGSVIPAFR